MSRPFPSSPLVKRLPALGPGPVVSGAVGPEVPARAWEPAVGCSLEL